MRTVGELFDRVSGIAGVRQQLDTARADIRRTLDMLIDHERRLVRLETLVEVSTGRPQLPPRGFSED